MKLKGDDKMNKKHNYPKTRKPGSGGARPGAGAPKKDPTTTLAYRVPKNTAWIVDATCRACISDLAGRDLSGDFTGSVSVAISLNKTDPPDPLSDISRKVISAHLDKETAEVRELLKKQKK